MDRDALPDDSLLIETARVVAPFSGGAWVAVVPAGGCQRCQSRQGCGAGLLSAWRRPAERRLAILADRPLRVGDSVRIGIDSKRVLNGALLVYGLPLCLSLVAGSVAEMAWPSYQGSVPMAFGAGLLAGFGVSHWLARRWAGLYRPRLMEILVSNDNNEIVDTRLTSIEGMSKGDTR
ncbi:SoxR reducing system RseC family protein [Aidingimonas lacisalsi]|uniref:SoxR reducing system RseC family protein n=1 Tax=Aidingimonas lacisalsi TaxID=2604086 RepID=UPI00137627D8|nr:SoxR reducing system RseC family protein [Aidingimonas lacisalsi]